MGQNNAFVLTSEYSRRIAHELDWHRDEWQRKAALLDATERRENEQLKRFMARSHEELLLDSRHFAIHHAAALEVIVNTQSEIRTMKLERGLRRPSRSEVLKREELIARVNYATRLASALNKAERTFNIGSQRFHVAKRYSGEEFSTAETALTALWELVHRCLKEDSLDALKENQGVLDEIRTFWARLGTEFLHEHSELIWEEEVGMKHTAWQLDLVKDEHGRLVNVLVNKKKKESE